MVQNSPYPYQPGSAFSYNYDPNAIARVAANPTVSYNGAPAASGLQQFTFQPPQTQGANSQAQAPSSSAQTSLQSFAPNIASKALSNSMPGIGSSINDFGATTGIFSNPAATSLGATVDSTMGASGLSGTGIDAATNAMAGTEGVSSAVASADAAATPGAVGAVGATATSVLGAAGLGAIGGSVLAKALGENPLGGSIGGAIGAGVGMAFGGAGAAALGLELGAFAGPLGALIGGVGGAIFGGMFGNKTPATSAAEGAYTLGTDGSVKLNSQGTKNSGQYAGYPTQIESALGSQLSSVEKATGIKFNQTDFRAGVNTRHSPSGSPGYIAVGGQNFGFTPGDRASQTTATNQAIQYMATQSGASPEQMASLNNYFSTGVASGGQEPTISVNPSNPQASQPNDFQTFVANYKAQQNANAV